MLIAILGFYNGGYKTLVYGNFILKLKLRIHFESNKALHGKVVAINSQLWQLYFAMNYMF